jgi:hypothetical protein
LSAAICLSVSEKAPDACGGADKYVSKQKKSEWYQQVFVNRESQVLGKQPKSQHFYYAILRDAQSTGQVKQC